jgi:hypothetical protein
MAYAKIYSNQGAMTPGTANDTADGMSVERIEAIIAALRTERFYFRPSRRGYADKKNGGKRPLGLPDFTEKLVQEVLRMVLEAYYEPRFKESSHGFRTSRRSPTDADVADGPAFRSDPRSRPDQSTGYWLKNVFSTRAMSSGATTCPCPSSVCRSVWGMAAVIAFAARSKKSVGRPANWGSVVGPSVVTRTD